MQPLVSIIIPTYNRKNWVVKAIDSALSQTYTKIEVIVIDDGSTDGSYEYLQKLYGQKIILKKIRHSGVSKARNTALDLAKGEWISFLDSDDFFHIDKIAKQISSLQENPHYKIAHSEEIWYKNGVRINPKKQHKKMGGDLFAQSVKLCSISISTVILKKEILVELGNFDENLPACEDYELWLRITAKYQILFNAEYLTTKFGGHIDQLSKKYQAMDRFRIYALKKLLVNTQLNIEQRTLVKDSLKKKLQIFLNGAKKHGNLHEYEAFKTEYKDFLN